jgi:hypothetical protein
MVDEVSPSGLLVVVSPVARMNRHPEVRYQCSQSWSAHLHMELLLVEHPRARHLQLLAVAQACFVVVASTLQLQGQSVCWCARKISWEIFG